MISDESINRTRFDKRKHNKIQTPRLYELDLLKALAIVSMILCHCAIRLGQHWPGYEQDVRYLIGDIVFGDYLAVAHAFMFAMGVTVNFSRKNSPGALFRRGLWLYVLGFILNFFRYGIYALADGLLSGTFVEDTVYALIVQDILHFAGLALMATGLFKRLRLKEVHILLIGVLLSALGGPLAFVCQGSPAGDYFLGHFLVTTEDNSCFVFFNWYVFVAFGMWFGAVLRRTEDPERFYGLLLRIACPVMAAYLALTVVFGPFFLTKNGWYYAASLPEAAGLLSIDLTLLAAFFFFAETRRRLPAARVHQDEPERQPNLLHPLVHPRLCGFDLLLSAGGRFSMAVHIHVRRRADRPVRVARKALGGPETAGKDST